MPRRSLWKGSFLDAFLLKMKKKSGRLSNKKIYSRRSTILPEFVDSTVQIYNGHAWIRCKITEGKVGHKFGEFALTRKRRPSSRTNTGKQKNVGSQKKPNVGSQKRSMSTFCGHRDGSSVSTTLHNSAVLLPWMLLRTRGIQTLPSFAPWNKSLQLGNSPPYLHGEAGLRRISGNSSPYFNDFCPDGDDLVCVDTSHATMGICRSLVCRAIRQDCAPLDVFPGTGIRADGMGATSAASLSPLEGTESKVTADVGGSLVDQCGTFLVTRMMNMMPKLLQIY